MSRRHRDAARARRLHVVRAGAGHAVGGGGGVVSACHADVWRILAHLAHLLQIVSAGARLEVVRTDCMTPTHRHSRRVLAHRRTDVVRARRWDGVCGVRQGSLGSHRVRGCRVLALLVRGAVLARAGLEAVLLQRVAAGDGGGGRLADRAVDGVVARTRGQLLGLELLSPAHGVRRTVAGRRDVVCARRDLPVVHAILVSRRHRDAARARRLHVVRAGAGHAVGGGGGVVSACHADVWRILAHLAHLLQIVSAGARLEVVRTDCMTPTHRHSRRVLAHRRTDVVRARRWDGVCGVRQGSLGSHRVRGCRVLALLVRGAVLARAGLEAVLLQRVAAGDGGGGRLADRAVDGVVARTRGQLLGLELLSPAHGVRRTVAGRRDVVCARRDLPVVHAILVSAPPS